ncbi:MAG: acyloxyacyl hydrolase [Acidobacteriaceae bacterium]
MRTTRLCILLFLLSTIALAQDELSVKHPNWNLGVFAVGGNGLSQNTDIHMFGFGGRLGRVLTNEHGGGILRGSLEWNAEVMPFYQFYSPGDTATGAVINPLVAKYNFTRGHKLIPFFEAIGGIIFTNKNFPPGDTAEINFNSGAGVGFNLFTRNKRSIAFDVRALHISNASIGNHNPGVNTSLQFTLGYTWWK